VDDTSPIVGKSYQYAVSAVDKRGNESALSAWTTALASVVTDAPAAVAGTPTAIAYPTRMQIDWASVAGAVAYRVERSINSGSTYPTSYTVNSNRLDDVIAAGVEIAALALYRYRVKAISIYGALSATWATSGAPSTSAYGTYLPAAPTVSFSVAKRTLSALITPQSTLLNADGWDVQISRDNATWYTPNPAADTDADAWYTGSSGGMLKLNGPSLNLPYLPIPLDANSLPFAAGQAYYLRIRARCSSPAMQSAWTASTALTVYPVLGVDIATAQVKNAALQGGITYDKLAVSILSAIVANLGLVNAGKLRSYDYVAGVSGIEIDLDSAEISQGAGKFKLHSDGLVELFDVRAYGIDFEEIDCGTYSAVDPDDPYGDGGELDCGVYDGTWIPDRSINCGTILGED
jgi:hypothetical protein